MHDDVFFLQSVQSMVAMSMVGGAAISVPLATLRSSVDSSVYVSAAQLCTATLTNTTSPSRPMCSLDVLLAEEDEEPM